MRAFFAFLTWDLFLSAMVVPRRRRGRVRHRLARCWRDVLGLGVPLGFA